MNTVATLTPDDHENERASNGYLMSLLAIMVGMPLPIINLIATFIFYLGNRKSTFYVRWHCTQALLSQAFLLIINSVGFTWTMKIIFGDLEVTDTWISYMLTVSLFNIAEIVATIYAAQRVRRGHHVNFFLFGPLTNLLIRK